MDGSPSVNETGQTFSVVFGGERLNIRRFFDRSNEKSVKKLGTARRPVWGESLAG
jgi:hypothetical protein